MLIFGTQGQAFAQQVLDPNGNLVPREILNTAGNMSGALVICYLWYSDSKRKDAMLQSVLSSMTEQHKTFTEELSRMVRRD